MSLADAVDLRLVPQDAHAICRKLTDSGRKAWIVGGCVRDLLLKRSASDWDVATDARPDELLRIFPRAIPTGLAHGTVTVVRNGKHYEVTTLRGETTYTDGRRPDAVHFVDDIARDLARRDFTVNAIALDPMTGVIVDPFDGRGDIERRTLRAVGDPLERFSEDGLRVLRAARFAATLEMELDPPTEAAIEPSLSTYRKVSAERIRDEWMKAMRAARPSRAFEIMRKTGILAITCPEMLEGVEMVQNRWHAYDVWRHGMECLDACQGDAVLRIAAMLHDVGKPRTRAFSEKTNDWTFYEHDRIGAEIAEPICQRLRFSNDERATIVHLVRNHLICYSADWSDAAVRRWVKRVGRENLDAFYRLNEADVRAKGSDPAEGLETLEQLKAHVERVLAAGAALSTRDLAVNGHVLMKELGLPPGRQLGEILEALLEQVLAEPSLNDRAALLELARKKVEGH